MISFKQFNNTKENPFLGWKSSFGEVRNNSQENPFLGWKSSFGEVRKTAQENPFLGWKSSFGEIRNNQITEEEVLKHHNELTQNMSGGYRWDTLHDHPDIKPPELSDEHQQSVGNYTGASSDNAIKGHASSGNMNAYLRKRMGDIKSKIIGSHSPEKVKESIDRLSAVFTPENTNKKSVESFSGIPGRIGTKLQKLKPGDTHHIPGFTSTSTKYDTALGFARSYNDTKTTHVIKFHIKPNAGLSAVYYSRFPHENEIILHHGAKVSYLGRSSSVSPQGDKVIVHNMIVHPEHLSLDEYPHDY